MGNGGHFVAGGAVLQYDYRLGTLLFLPFVSSRVDLVTLWQRLQYRKYAQVQSLGLYALMELPCVCAGCHSINDQGRCESLYGENGTVYFNKTCYNASMVELLNLNETIKHLNRTSPADEFFK